MEIASRPTALLVLALLASACGDPLDQVRAPQHNVVLITIDTLRADHLGSYGYGREVTPNLDALARSGVRFERAFSPRGLTFPSVASILTSKYVYSHGVIGMYKTKLPEVHDTLAEVMSEAGYRTAGFTSHGALSPAAGFAQGFDAFRVRHNKKEPELIEEAKTWLEENREERFFLWLHSFGPHSPYQPTQEWQERFTQADYAGPYDGDQAQLYEIGRKQELSEEDEQHIKGLYDGLLAQVDDGIGRLLAQLDALGLREKTLVILSADHGEELFDHFFYFSHEASAYDGVLRVPLVLSLPGRIPAGQVVRDAVVESVDLAPTILDIVGVPAREPMQGQSLLPLLAGVEAPGHEYAYGSIDHRVERKSILTIRTARWRYLWNPDRYVPGSHLYYGEEELYDMDADPDAQENVADAHPEVAAELQRELVRWKEWTEAAHVSAETEGNQEVEDQLRALGYVDDAVDPAVAEAVAALRSASDAPSRNAAISELVKIGAPATTPLSLELSDDRATIRWRAAEALAQLGPAARGAVPALVGALSDSSDGVRWRVVRALGAIGGDEAKQALARAARDDTSEKVRAHATSTLQAMGDLPAS